MALGVDGGESQKQLGVLAMSRQVVKEERKAFTCSRATRYPLVEFRGVQRWSD